MLLLLFVCVLVLPSSVSVFFVCVAVGVGVAATIVVCDDIVCFTTAVVYLVVGIFVGVVVAWQFCVVLL